ncbi:MAG TPA: DUF3108 domain-containing protein [Rubrivivax sp.]|nr:DUF3108 domain-containing protein [Rubrivivax sp.]
MPPALDATRARGRRLATLSLVVLVGHLWLADGVVPSRLGDGDGQQRIKPIEVAFVRELQPSAVPAAAAVRRIAAPARSALPAAPVAAASSPVQPPLEQPPEVVLATVTAAPEVVADAASAAAPSASTPESEAALTSAAAAPSPAGSAPASQAFEWPPSTRLSYTLSGQFRGPVEGQARVEWLRSGTHYQVLMEASVGPRFAPLMTRRVSSEGEITADGLSPRRYEEETRAVMREPRRVSIVLDGDRVRLANGRDVPRPQGVQDSASQFVHLTWLFTTQPAWLTPGRSIELPLALPRHVSPWIYDVLDTETLYTPAGPVQAVHVKPRRMPTADGKPSGDLTAEMWVAPTLQYLPVRIIVRQDEATYIDMLIERLPQQSAPENAAVPNAGVTR